MSTLSAGYSPDAIDAAIGASIAAKPDGVLEEVAERHGVPLATVLDCLQGGAVVRAPGAHFEEIWKELTDWGVVMLIVRTQDGVFETKARLPEGRQGRGYFNLHGDMPIGGHIRSERCAAIYFVDRPFFGRRSCSLQFINVDGDAMFKVFVARDDRRELLPEQVANFEALRARMSFG
ncbi:heme utilization protein HuvX [Rhizobiales bacterium GAS113]|nr:heme utilization protein HuvX [Rhizobiales bacterium GAS113]